MWQRVVEPVTRVHAKSNISSTAIYSKMREYQLQFTTSKIGERKKRSTLLNAIDRLRYPATRRECCHPHLVGAPHNRKSLFFIMSRICFGFFYYRRLHASFEQLWKRKRTTGHESFLQLFRKRVFSQTKSSPYAHFREFRRWFHVHGHSERGGHICLAHGGSVHVPIIRCRYT